MFFFIITVYIEDTGELERDDREFNQNEQQEMTEGDDSVEENNNCKPLPEANQEVVYQEYYN